MKAIRVAGHRVEWHSKEDCTVTIDRAKGLKLMGPWMIEPEADVDASPVLDRLNELMGTKYRMTPQVGGMLRARMRTDKMTLEELIHVVEVKVQQMPQNAMWACWVLVGNIPTYLALQMGCDRILFVRSFVR